MAGDWSDVPYIQAASYGGARSRTPLIVIHATDNTASAAGEAKYCSTRTDGTSAHFFVDATSIYQCVPLADVAHGCFFHGNAISVQFELCGLSDHLTDAVIRNAARYVRRVCDKYAIPIVKLSPAQVRDAYYSSTPPKGICGHADVTLAFPEDNGTHTDPGSSFPWSTFLGYVKNAGGSMATIGDFDNALTALADFTTVNGQPGGIVGDHLKGRTQQDILNAVAALSGKVDAGFAALAAKVDALAAGGTSSSGGGVTAAELAKAKRAEADVLDPPAA